MTRESSPESVDSTLSNINVDIPSSTASSIAESVTPPTSLASKDTSSNASFGGKPALQELDAVTAQLESETHVANPTGRKIADPHRRRSGRARHSIATYNENVLSGTHVHGHRGRNVSGDTLVGSESEPRKQRSTNFDPKSQLDKALKLDWELPRGSPKKDSGDSDQPRRSSRIEAVKEKIEDASQKAKEVVSTLGKRGREAIEGLAAATKLATGEPARKKSKTELEAEEREKQGQQPNEITSPRRKRYLPAGIYAGMSHDFSGRGFGIRNKKKTSQDDGEKVEPKVAGFALNGMEKNKTLPPPMFSGERFLEQGRDFKLPFDIFCPLPKVVHPEDWKKTSRNRFVGDALQLWKKSAANLPPSHCICQPPSDGELGCDDDCQNRHMMYECDESNCLLGDKCSNRSFNNLKKRTKKGNPYDIGVEVLKTEKRGYGVRSMRSFQPDQIIMEYTGEIVTVDEMERRINEDYKDNDCYYIMEFQNGMYIDATRGSMARFVNHSCEPNCRMVKWVVAGQPRMALFAGKDGVMTGQELTYDYNFQNFNQKEQPCYCGAKNCRGVLGPRNNQEAKQKKESVLASAKRKLGSALSSSKKRKSSGNATEQPATKKQKTTTKSVKITISSKNKSQTQKKSTTPAKLSGKTPLKGKQSSTSRRVSSSSTTALVSKRSPVRGSKVSKSVASRSTTVVKKSQAAVNKVVSYSSKVSTKTSLRNSGSTKQSDITAWLKTKDSATGDGSRRPSSTGASGRAGVVRTIKGKGRGGARTMRVVGDDE